MRVPFNPCLSGEFTLFHYEHRDELSYCYAVSKTGYELQVSEYREQTSYWLGVLCLAAWLFVGVFVTERYWGEFRDSIGQRIKNNCRCLRSRRNRARFITTTTTTSTTAAVTQCLYCRRNTTDKVAFL